MSGGSDGDDDDDDAHGDDGDHVSWPEVPHMSFEGWEIFGCLFLVGPGSQDV